MSHTAARVPSSADLYRAMLADQPDAGALHALLAQALHEGGDHDGAIAAADDALAVDRGDPVARMTRAASLMALCRFDEAAAEFAMLARALPGRTKILIGLGTACAEAGRPDDAVAALTAALAADHQCAEAAAALGAVCARTGNAAAAITACRYALALDPGQIAAHQNLAALLPADDPAVPVHRDAAYRHQQVFTIAGPPGAPSILVLTCAASGNVPLEHLLPRTGFTQIRWFIDYATPGQDRILPKHDLIFNAIGDRDLMPAIPPPVDRLLRLTGKPILNHPDRIRRTGRADLPALLDGIADVVVPPVSRIAAPADLVRSCHRLPVIVRPAGSHGGEGLHRADDWDAVGAMLARDAPAYVTDYVDYAGNDGLYRKYRMIFVAGAAYPYHLAIGAHWLVHYWTAGMEAAADRRAEERRFLDDPAGAIGARAMAAVAAIGARLGLDYAGIDFSVLPDGRVLVFEANATMLVHPEREAAFGYKNPAVARILAAFAGLMMVPPRVTW